jgi:hypothetical protein
MGYYIGYLVLSDIARTHSLAELGVMTPAEARPLIDQAIQRMAACS